MSGEPSLAYVIGRNAKLARLAADLTLDQVAAAARRQGLKWSESRVADFEAGRFSPNLTTLIAVCLALTDAGCTNATLPQLVSNDMPVEINDSLALWGYDLENVLVGKPVRKPQRDDHTENPAIHTTEGTRSRWEDAVLKAYRHQTDIPTIRKVQKESGATEARISKALKISPMLLSLMSAVLWGRTFSQERDRRAGRTSKADAQYRGHVSRQMQAELNAAMEATTDGHDKQLPDRQG